MSTVRLGRQKEAVNEDITCLQRGNVDRHSRGELIKYAKKEQLPLEVKAVGYMPTRNTARGMM